MAAGILARRSPARPGSGQGVPLLHALAPLLAKVGHFQAQAVGVGEVRGLYSEGGSLQHVGVASSFTAAQRTELTSTLAPYVMSLAEVASHPWSDWAQAEAHESGVRMPGAPNRWSGQRDHSWIPLRPELVAEVGFQQLTHGRLRHPAAFLRWRPDKDASECTYDQFEVAVPAEFESIFGV